MSMQALKIINEKHQDYAKLLRLCQKRLANDEIKEIQRKSAMFLMIKMPNYELDKIENFCASNFLKELELAKEIASMRRSNAADFLGKKFGLWLEGHTSEIKNIKISSDDKYIVSSGDDNTLRIWDLQNKTQKAILQRDVHWIDRIAVTSDNKYIVYSEHNFIQLLNIQNKKQETILRFSSKITNAIVITSDSRYIIYDEKKCVIIWDIQEKRKKATLEGHGSSINSIALTSDNKYIVSASNDKTLIIWDLQEQKKKLLLKVTTQLAVY